MTNFFLEMQTSLAGSRGECSVEEIKGMINHLVGSLNALPNPILTEVFCLGEDLPSTSSDMVACNEKLKSIFQQFDNILRLLMSRETQDIFRRIIFTRPNTFSMTMTTPDEVALDGIYLKNNEHPDATTLVFCNDSKTTYEGFYLFIRHLQDREATYYVDKEGNPFNFVFFNYRGVGHSTAEPDPQGVLIDGYTAVHAVQTFWRAKKKYHRSRTGIRRDYCQFCSFPASRKFSRRS